MPKENTESKVYRSLSKVEHPDFPGRNLVTLGMISEVSFENNHITVVLALPTPEFPNKQTLVEKVQRVVEDVAEDLDVQVKETEMDAEQREKFSTIAMEDQRASKPIGHIQTVLAVMSGKGGVGKSSIAGLLGILDADITGPSIPMMFGANQIPEAGSQGIIPVSSRSGIKLMSINLLLSNKDQPIVWRGPLIGRAIQQFWEEIEWGDLDFLIVDLPPGTADASLTVMQSLPLDGIILVISPQDLAGMVVRKAANMAKGLEIPLIGLVENMSFIVCPKCSEKILVFGKSQAENSAKMIGTPMLGHLPLDTLLSVLCDCGTIEDYHNEEIERITDKVIDFITTGEKLSSERVPTT